jgi:carbonic anhydrase
VLESAARFRESFVSNHRSARPERHLVVVTCMDARLDLFRLLGLDIGDAHILRNAGGRVTEDVVRSLVLSSHALGTREVLVIHHTECGLFDTSNDEIRSKVHAATGTRPDDIDFLPFDDVHASVHNDVGHAHAGGLTAAIAAIVAARPSRISRRNASASSRDRVRRMGGSARMMSHR